MRPSLLALIVFAIATSGCVISETERGPGPGDEKKAAATTPAAEPSPSDGSDAPARP